MHAIEVGVVRVFSGCLPYATGCSSVPSVLDVSSNRLSGSLPPLRLAWVHRLYHRGGDHATTPDSHRRALRRLFWKGVAKGVSQEGLLKGERLEQVVGVRGLRTPPPRKPRVFILGFLYGFWGLSLIVVSKQILLLAFYSNVGVACLGSVSPPHMVAAWALMIGGQPQLQLQHGHGTATCIPGLCLRVPLCLHLFDAESKTNRKIQNHRSRGAMQDAFGTW